MISSRRPEGQSSQFSTLWEEEVSDGLWGMDDILVGYGPLTSYVHSCILDYDTGIHALEVGEAGDALDGMILILIPEARVPGHPAVHDRDIQDGELQYNR